MIDVHTHAINPVDWGTEFDRHWKPVYGSDYPANDVEAFDDAMAEGGVSLAIVFGLAADAAGVRTSSESVAEFCAAATTPTIGFMALDPTAPSWREEIDTGVALGLRGIKLYPVLAGFDPRDTALDPFYEVADRAGLVLMWHMGTTPSPIGDLSITNPLLVDHVARRFPDLGQIIAHMGHPWQRDCVAVIRKNRKVFADVSGVFARPMDAYLALVNAQEWGVVPKLLFGSDYPLWTPTQAVEALRAVCALGGSGFPRVEPETVDSILNSDPTDVLGLRPHR